MLNPQMSLIPLLVTPLLPLTLPAVAQAQITTSSSEIQVVTRSDETLYFQPDTYYELPMEIDAAVTIDGRNFSEGTVIQGRLEPISGGLQYVATGIEAGGFTQSLSATSELLADVKDPRETSLGSIAGDAAIGAAGGAVLGAIIGDGVSVWEILGGAAAGAAVGNVTAQRVVILEPNQPISLQVQ